jgi:PhnB protein
MNKTDKVTFSPQLYINSGITDLSFYEEALGAVEVRRFSNIDGSIHVAELEIGGQIFHFHEESLRTGLIAPERCKGTTVQVGLFVEDVDAYMNRSVDRGAIVITPAQDYDYGYRQGEIRDPFGHRWMFESVIPR